MYGHCMKMYGLTAWDLVHVMSSGMIASRALPKVARISSHLLVLHFSVWVFISSRLLGSSTCTRTVWKVSSPKPFWLCWQQLDFFWIAPTYPTILAAPGEIISFPSGPHHMSQGWCLLDLISLASVSGPLWAQGEERRGAVALLARPRSFD